MTVEELNNYQELPTQAPTVWSRTVELTIINVIGSIPRPLGTLLRRLAYRSIFARMGRRVYNELRVAAYG
jgi:hypothetical protein